MRFLVPESDEMLPIPLGVDGQGSAGACGVAVESGGDPLRLAALMTAHGVDAAWTLTPREHPAAIGWLALRLIDLDGGTIGAARSALRVEDPLEPIAERIDDTPLGRGLRLVQRFALTAPAADRRAGGVVVLHACWSWSLTVDGRAAMLVLSAATTALTRSGWLIGLVDEVARGFALDD